ncbi:MAG: hypothetical protein JSV99_10565 [Planctomycetota bacterium]|nr:MAG: hypothetical protein JSV99_10565 [Planctomycetota bacterium]
MSPDGQVGGGRAVASNNLYTAILALAVGAVAATAFFVVFMCHHQYGVYLKIP